MKERSPGFLSDKFINHDSEQFDYIVELHEYLWRFVRAHIPSAGGHISTFLDAAICLAEQKQPKDELKEL
jgi:hypothetical protein